MTCRHCGGPVPAKVPGRPGPARSTCDECKAEQKRTRSTRARPPKGYPKARPTTWRYRPGDRFGALVMLERDGQRATFACDCGEVTELQLNNVTSGRITRCSSNNHVRPNRLPDDQVSYDTAHRRVRDMRGPASLYRCTLCDRQAKDWAFTYAAPRFRTGAEGGRGAGSPYSTDPAHYMPLCRRCHHHHDRQSHIRRDKVSLRQWIEFGDLPDPVPVNSE